MCKEKQAIIVCYLPKEIKKDFTLFQSFELFLSLTIFAHVLDSKDN
jgi:hypothetical protein